MIPFFLVGVIFSVVKFFSCSNFFAAGPIFPLTSCFEVIFGDSITSSFFSGCAFFTSSTFGFVLSLLSFLVIFLE